MAPSETLPDETGSQKSKMEEGRLRNQIKRISASYNLYTTAT